MVALKVVEIGSEVGVILPEGVLAALDLRDGDLLQFTYEEDGSIRLMPHGTGAAEELPMVPAPEDDDDGLG